MVSKKEKSQNTRNPLTKLSNATEEYKRIGREQAKQIIADEENGQKQMTAEEFDEQIKANVKQLSTGQKVWYSVLVVTIIFFIVLGFLSGL